MPKTFLPLLALAFASVAQAEPDIPDAGLSAPAGLQPPRVLEAPAAIYPTGHTEAANVSLRVKLSADGEVLDTEVLLSAGADFDHAAQIAVLKWKFAPATRDGVAIPSRISIPFIFQPPPPQPGPAVDGGDALGADAGDLAPAAPIDTSDAGPVPVVTAAPEAPTVAEPALPAGAEEVNVRGEQRKPERGGSDFEIPVGQIAAIAGQSPESLLELAPGIFIANEGGAGHADQVFLRGFDAEQGQAIEFTVNGVPINQVDNTDGHGYADTHFIIPELVKNLRVLEGPFDPHQGDFAEAGSAEYELGVTDRRLVAELQYGSFNTERVLALWAPEGQRDGTFAAVQATQSAGYGTNRGSQDASAMAQYEGELGDRGLWRLLGTAYATHYQSAGVVSSADVASGAVGFYGTEDPSQGGDAQHYSASLQLIDPTKDGTLTQQMFVIYNEVRILEDFTGFLLDPQEPGQTTHPQRGDGILQQYSSITAGGRGSYRLEGTLFGQPQAIEVGYYARYDHTTPEIQRVEFGTQIPYEYDENLETDIFNIAGYLDLDLHPLKWLTLRGGVRQEYFDYNVLNLCELPNQYVPYSGLLNVVCGTIDPEGGTRLPSQRSSATALITEPKVTALAQLPHGFSLTASYGQGAQSIDATYITQDEQAPFAAIQAGEAGALYRGRVAGLDVTGRGLYYLTHVGQDLVFNPDLGRLTESSGTTRQGAVAAGRVTGRWFDELASFTYAYATFDSDGTLVPYVPNVIARSDTAVFGKLPWRLLDHPITGTAGLGLSFVGDRALPLGQTASPSFTVDLSASLRWDLIKLGLLIQNLTDSQYALSEFFYASDFHHQTYATLAPVEEFTAAPPFAAMVSLSVILDKESRP